MRSYRCDRCGSHFANSSPTDPPQNPASDPGEFGLTSKMPIVYKKRIVVVEVDLCGPCVTSLSKWMSTLEASAIDCLSVVRGQRDAANLQIDGYRKVIDAAKRLDRNYVKWELLGLAGVDMLDALIQLHEAEAVIAKKPVGERQRCQETMASDFVCGEHLPCKIHHILACSYCGAFDEPVHREGCAFLKKRKCECGGEDNAIGCIPGCPAYIKRKENS